MGVSPTGGGFIFEVNKLFGLLTSPPFLQTMLDSGGNKPDKRIVDQAEKARVPIALHFWSLEIELIDYSDEFFCTKTIPTLL